MNDLPTGTVTFLFTDIEGSTLLWEHYPEQMKAILSRHDAILRDAIESNNGTIVKTTGDGVHAVFFRAMDTLKAAITSQQNLQSLRIKDGQSPAGPEQIKVRMGLHTGEAELREGDYYGQALNRAARIMEVAYGRQVLLSAVTASLVRDQLNVDMNLLDLGEHRLRNLARPEHIFQLASPNLSNEFPPLRSLSVLSNNLPVQLTSFIGRERELAEAKHRFENARLLTLIGPGGTGKTRISLQLGANLLPDFKDGVWLVELAALTHPSMVLQSFARVVYVREQPGMPLKELVVDYLREKHLLLILDNCEHLIDTCAKLAEEFLHHAQNIKIIASSREALGIGGETVYRVPSLSLPEQVRYTSQAATGFESVQLFVERGAAASPGFHLTDGNASSVTQVCQRLDGIPLAIELAASRLRMFSVEQIAARLDDRFKLLTGGSRTALPRQQTLRALIDWSYDILTVEEQALLRRLSVFAGGWTFEAGEAVCDDPDFLDNLSRLINKSLVFQDENEGNRYRLLETIRQYGRDKLLEFGEGMRFRNRHLEYFLTFAKTGGQYIQGREAFSWANELRTEYDNIRAALEWGLAEDIESALRIVSALPYFWITQGYAVEGRGWALDVLEKVKSQNSRSNDLTDNQLNARADAYLSLSIIATDLGDNQLVLTSANESIRLAQRAGDQRILAFALAYLAAGKANLGEVEEAFPIAEEALTIARASKDEFALGYALTVMGEVSAMAKQDYESAQAYAEKSIALSKKMGYHWGYSMAIFGLGYMSKTLGDYQQARARFNDCLPIFHEIGDKHRINMIQSELAHIEREQGRYQQAIPMYRETIREWQRLGHRAAIAHQLECLAFIAKAQDQAECALKLLGAAEALREKIKIAMTPPERIVYDREVTDLKVSMGENEFITMWSNGRELSMELAIQFAVESV
jgi:predicted ATPase/class 3 adenylate cyclase